MSIQIDTLPAEPQSRCVQEQAARLWTRLEDYLLRNRETISIAEAMVIYKTQERCGLIMTRIPKSNP